MSDVHANAGYLQVTFHNDDETPLEFVIELLHSVFKKPMADAMRFSEAVSNTEKPFALPIRATLPTNCLKLPGSASVLAVIRSG
jgi:hypothetical protein